MNCLFPILVEVVVHIFADDVFISFYLLLYPFFYWYCDLCVGPLDVLHLLSDCEAPSRIGLDTQPV